MTLEKMQIKDTVYRHFRGNASSGFPFHVILKVYAVKNLRPHLNERACILREKVKKTSLKG